MPAKSTQTIMRIPFMCTRSSGLIETRSEAESVLISGGEACTVKAVRWRVPTWVVAESRQPAPAKVCVLTFQAHQEELLSPVGGGSHSAHSQPVQPRSTPEVAPLHPQRTERGSPGHAETDRTRCEGSPQFSAASAQPWAEGPETFQASGRRSSLLALKPGTQEMVRLSGGGAGLGRATSPALL